MRDRPRTWKPYLPGILLLCMAGFALLVEGPLRSRRGWVDPDARRVAGAALAVMGVWSIVLASRRR